MKASSPNFRQLVLICCRVRPGEPWLHVRHVRSHARHGRAMYARGGPLFQDVPIHGSSPLLRDALPPSCGALTPSYGDPLLSLTCISPVDLYDLSTLVRSRDKFANPSDIQLAYPAGGFRTGYDLNGAVRGRSLVVQLIVRSAIHAMSFRLALEEFQIGFRIDIVFLELKHGGDHFPQACGTPFRQIRRA